MDLRTERHEFTPAEWRRRQRERKRADAQEQREHEARARLRAEYRTWLTDTLGLEESHIAHLRPAPEDHRIYAWLALWPADDPMQRRVRRLMQQRWRADLELSLVCQHFPTAVKRRLAVALATTEEDTKETSS
jgi:hypothetical protein